MHNVLNFSFSFFPSFLFGKREKANGSYHSLGQEALDKQKAFLSSLDMNAPGKSHVLVYGVATISRLLKMIGLFCRISSLL